MWPRALHAALALLCCLIPPLAQAHEALPGVLELRERSDASYAVNWHQPVGSDGPVQAMPKFPDDCRFDGRGGASLSLTTPAALGTLRCAVRLGGREIAITDWRGGGSPAVLVRWLDDNGREEQHLLRPARPVVELNGETDSARLLHSYFALGVSHILLGADHLAFVTGLLLVASLRWRIAASIAAFTAGHSITIAAATLGWIAPPAASIEVAIALSIVFVALESARERRGRETLAQRVPWVAALAFGLLHGFGFAGNLSMTGVPASDIPWALLSFNLGVEAGQLMFVLALAALAMAARSLPERKMLQIKRTATYVIGTLGAYWMMERMLAV